MKRIFLIAVIFGVCITGFWLIDSTRDRTQQRLIDVAKQSSGQIAPAAMLAGDEHASAGLAAWKRGDYALCARELEAAIEGGLRQHKLSEIYNVLGLSLAKLDRLDEAVKAHQTAVVIEPGLHPAWVNLAEDYRLSGKLQDARQCLDKAELLDSSYAPLHVAMGMLRLTEDRPGAAVACLEQAVSLAPTDPSAQSSLALAYAAAGRFAEADAALRQAIVLGCDDSQKIARQIDQLKALTATTMPADQAQVKAAAMEVSGTGPN